MISAEQLGTTFSGSFFVPLLVALTAALIIAVITAVWRLGGRLSRIESQYSNNGGSTIRDAVDRIETVVNEVKVEAATDRQELKSHIEQAAYNMGRVDTFMHQAPQSVQVDVHATASP